MTNHLVIKYDETMINALKKWFFKNYLFTSNRNYFFIFTKVAKQNQGLVNIKSETKEWRDYSIKERLAIDKFDASIAFLNGLLAKLYDGMKYKP